MVYIILYLIAGATTIYAENEEYIMLMYISKVMLMPLLALYFHYHSKRTKPYVLIYLALFFSWLGDIFLMIPRNENSPDSKMLFTAGLAAFLIGHLNYIAHFTNEIRTKFRSTVFLKSPYLVLPVVLYIVVLLRLLFPALKEMKIPVTIYGIVIGIMLLSAVNRKNLVNETSYYFVLIGALLFVFSDSCIAVNLFYEEFELARMVIMLTYVLAQIIIIKGVLEAKPG